MASSTTTATGNSNYTPISEISKIHKQLFQTYYSNKTQDVAWRKRQLKLLAYLVKDNLDELSAAVKSDLGRSPNETYMAELGGLINECVSAVHNVEKWAKPERPSVAFDRKMLRPTIYKEPKAPALIISTWNFPVSLTLLPLIGAIAAGSPAVIKCSEVAPATAALIAKLIPQYLDTEAYTVVLGEVDVATKLLELPWGHIFYTGNTSIAKIIATAAAKTLTPITLELGGKSPCIIDPQLDDLQTAVRRILWAKRTNAGQVCLSPDFIIVTKDKHAALMETIKSEIKRCFSANDDLRSDDYPRIVSHAHFDRLQKSLEKTSGTVVCEGQKDRESKMMGITIVDGVSWEDELMKSEIFGPILPIVTVSKIDDALLKMQDRTPLALYVFSKSKRFIDHVRLNTRSGAIVVNDLLLHFTVDELPFGGVGESGMGSYHGKRSFDVFTHERASLSTPYWAELILGIRYYPYTDRNTWLFKQTIKKINFSRPSSSSVSDSAISLDLGGKLLKYTLLAALAAAAIMNRGWIVAALPQYKLVKVD